MEVDGEQVSCEEGNVYDIGDRIGQLVIMKIPTVNIVEVEELSSSER